LYAIADSTVVRNGKKSSKFTRLEIKLPNGDTAVYQHGLFPYLKEDDPLKQGDIVGTMSDIGCSGQVHLHFEIRKNGKY
jgi:murein DD-endopeptidase MepM/ murein hydrolase activator NlpD